MSGNPFSFPDDVPVKFTIAQGVVVAPSGNNAYENYGILRLDKKDKKYKQFTNIGSLENYGLLNNSSGTFVNSRKASINNYSGGVITNTGHGIILDQGTTDNKGTINIGIENSDEALWDVRGNVTNSGIVNLNYWSTIKTAKDSTFVIEKDGKVENQGYWPNNGDLKIYGLLDNYYENTFFVNEGEIEIFAGGKLENEGDFRQLGNFINNGSVQTTTNANDSRGFKNWGTYSGSGVISGRFFNEEGGKFSPGNSAGGSMVVGDFHHNGGVKQIELGGSSDAARNQLETEFDFIDVTGDLILDGGSLEVELINDFKLVADQEFIIAHVGGDLIGQYDNLKEGDSVGKFEMEYGGEIDLFISYVAGDGGDIGLYTMSSEDPSWVWDASGVYVD